MNKKRPLIKITLLIFLIITSYLIATKFYYNVIDITTTDYDKMSFKVTFSYFDRHDNKESLIYSDGEQNQGFEMSDETIALNVYYKGQKVAIVFFEDRHEISRCKIYLNVVERDGEMIILKSGSNDGGVRMSKYDKEGNEVEQYFIDHSGLAYTRNKFYYEPRELKRSDGLGHNFVKSESWFANNELVRVSFYNGIILSTSGTHNKIEKTIINNGTVDEAYYCLLSYDKMGAMMKKDCYDNLGNIIEPPQKK